MRFQIFLLMMKQHHVYNKTTFLKMSRLLTNLKKSYIFLLKNAENSV